MFCAKCGTENEGNAKFCCSCGAPINNSTPAQAIQSDHKKTGPQFEAVLDTRTNSDGAQVTTVNIQTPQQGKNGIAIAGFVLALIGVFVSWVPVFGWIIWILGALFSLVGVFKQPRGFAIAGLCCSFIDLILLLFVIAGCTATTGGIIAMSGI